MSNINGSVSGIVQTLGDGIADGTPDTFGIARQEENGQLCLVTRRRRFPILILRCRLRNEDGSSEEITEETWSGEALFDALGAMPLAARFAFRCNGWELDSDHGKGSGHLLLLAAPRADSDKVLGIELVFSCEGENPQTSIIWDTSPDMVHSWHTSILAGL